MRNESQKVKLTGQTENIGYDFWGRELEPLFTMAADAAGSARLPPAYLIFCLCAHVLLQPSTLFVAGRI